MDNNEKDYQVLYTKYKKKYKILLEKLKDVILSRLLTPCAPKKQNPFHAKNNKAGMDTIKLSNNIKKNILVFL